MPYESRSEKHRPKSPLSKMGYDQTDEVLRVRAILIILLIIKLAFSVFYFVLKVVNLVQYTRYPAHLRNDSLMNALVIGLVTAAIIVLCLLLFIYVVIRKIAIGILIFAWLSILDLVFVLVIFSLTIVTLVGMYAAKHASSIEITGNIIVVVVTVIAALLTFFTILYSFKLAKLIKLQEGYELL